MNKIKILVHKINDDVKIPEYQSELASGCDVHAYIKENIIIKPQETTLIPTGLKVAIPEGFEIQIRPRSGMSLKTPFRVANAPGSIDSDFRGEIKIIAHNCSEIESIVIEPNQRIAQLIVAPVYQAVFTMCNELPATIRGEGGFGSTNK